MSHTSCATQPVEPVLELDGIRYQSAGYCHDVELPAPYGYLAAVDIQTGHCLWIKQIYGCQSDVAPEYATTAHGPGFLRIKYQPGTRDILIENTSRSKYFINIDTQEVRKATSVDFSPLTRRAPPPEVPPIEYNGMRYMQIMNGFEEGRGLRCGLLEGIDIKTNRGIFLEQIYTVPFNDEIDDDQQECYFTRMVLLPGQQDILIENEAGAKYLFNLKQRCSRPLTIPEADYRPERVSMGEGIKDVVKFFFGIKPRDKDKFSL